ncbi:MAG: ABC transporter permease [Trueperaceae bacterium]|nr:ABC transporter permease [Trueperaceae bacterium]
MARAPDPPGRVRRLVLATVGPGILWITLLLILPSLILLAYSFLTRYQFNRIGLPLTLEHYATFIGYTQLGYDPVYLLIFARTLLLAVGVTLLCLLLGYPLALFIARSKRRNLLLVLVMIPFWTNFLIRTYAWLLILAGNGPVNGLLKTIGVIQDSLQLVPSLGAVFVGMVYAHLPFLVLPVYSSLEKVDWRLVEAAMDLGAGPARAFRHGIFPQTVPGVVAGSLLVFVPALGNFITPDLLGGSRNALIGNVIQQQFGSALNWPFGSAISFVVLGFVLLSLYIYARMLGERSTEVLV